MNQTERVKKWRKKVPKGRCLNDGSTHFKKGCTPWNKGKTMFEETKKKISDAKKKNPTKYWLGKNNSLQQINKFLLLEEV